MRQQVSRQSKKQIDTNPTAGIQKRKPRDPGEEFLVMTKHKQECNEAKAVQRGNVISFGVYLMHLHVGAHAINT
jgi:hypothetical protein